MRKLIFGQFLSLEGYAADRAHSTKFFESQEWNAGGADTDMLDLMQEIDTMLMGRVTYEMFHEFWPKATSEDDAVADKLNSLHKVVFSKTLKEADWGKHEAPRIESGDAVEAVKKMKAEEGKTIVIWGSISVANELLKAGLVDEIQIRWVPKLIGKGTLQFTEDMKARLELIETRSYPSGLVLVRYKMS